MLKRLYVHNYRCLLNFELRPGASGLLLGYNGAGKTSVFDILGAIQDLLVNNEEAIDAFPSDTLTRLEDSSRQRFELDMTSPHGEIRYTLVLDHDAEHETCIIASESVVSRGELGEVPVYVFEAGEVMLRGITPEDVHTIPFTSERSYLASVDVDRAHAKLAEFLTFIRGIWILKLNPQVVLASARRDEPWLNTDGSNFPGWCRHLLLESRERVAAAEAQLREVLPGFRSLIVQSAGRVRVLVARFSGEGKKSIDLDFDMLSDGQRALIILYVALHAVRGEASIICLDEPDNFVSIREIQPFLIELLNACDDDALQALIISHSAEVIDTLGPANALLLERPDGGATRVARVGDAPGLRLSERMARGWHTALTEVG